jgi:hypothetical protein
VELAKCSGLLKSKLETETVVELLQLNTSEAAAATGAMDHRHLVQKKTPLQVQVQVGEEQVQVQVPLHPIHLKLDPSQETLFSQHQNMRRAHKRTPNKATRLFS